MMKFTNFKLSEHKIANFGFPESKFKINLNLKKNSKTNNTATKLIC